MMGAPNLRESRPGPVPVPENRYQASEKILPFPGDAGEDIAGGVSKVPEVITDDFPTEELSSDEEADTREYLPLYPDEEFTNTGQEDEYISSEDDNIENSEQDTTRENVDPVLLDIIEEISRGDIEEGHLPDYMNALLNQMQAEGRNINPQQEQDLRDFARQIYRIQNRMEAGRQALPFDDVQAQNNPAVAPQFQQMFNQMGRRDQLQAYGRWNEYVPMPQLVPAIPYVPAGMEGYRPNNREDSQTESRRNLLRGVENAGDLKGRFANLKGLEDFPLFRNRLENIGDEVYGDTLVDRALEFGNMIRKNVGRLVALVGVGATIYLATQVGIDPTALPLLLTTATISGLAVKDSFAASKAQRERQKSQFDKIISATKDAEGALDFIGGAGNFARAAA